MTTKMDLGKHKLPYLSHHLISKKPTLYSKPYFLFKFYLKIPLTHLLDQLLKKLSELEQTRLIEKKTLTFEIDEKAFDLEKLSAEVEICK